MAISPTLLILDLYNQSKLELWRSAASELAHGPEGARPLVQAGLHAVLACLRAEAATPRLLLDFFGRPQGPLGPHLRLVGSLLLDQDPRLGWTVVKAAYYHRWLELTGPSAADAVPRP